MMSKSLIKAQQRYRYKRKCRRLTKSAFEFIVHAPKTITVEEIIEELITSANTFNKSLEGFE